MSGRDRIQRLALGVVFLNVIVLVGCEDLAIRDTASLLVPDCNGPSSWALLQDSERPLPPCPT